MLRQHAPGTARDKYSTVMVGFVLSANTPIGIQVDSSMAKAKNSAVNRLRFMFYFLLSFYFFISKKLFLLYIPAAGFRLTRRFLLF